MASVIAAYLKQTWTGYPAGAPDQWGTRAAGSGATTPCRFWRRPAGGRDTQRVTLADGEVVDVRAVLQVPSTYSIAVGDTGTVTGETATFRVLQVTPVIGLDGTVDHKRADLA